MIPDDGIDEDQVLIDSTDYSGNPSDVTVGGTSSEPKITISVPTRDINSTGGRDRTEIPAGDYSITFKQNADITTPKVRGTKTITVDDGDADDHELEVVIEPLGFRQAQVGQPRRNGDGYRQRAQVWYGYRPPR